ncbi:MAG: MOP flippase family protein [Candidatus Omnitrophica bacterium]|nr:MOP flippase family protein [Candidatus Omnitrophota bacterium]
MDTLKQQTARGVKWLVGASFIEKTLSLGTTVILARILSPSIFGLFALAFVAINGLNLFKSMGFDSALIQRKDDIDKAANTAFFIIPLLGCILFLILYITTPFIGKFFNNHDVVPVLRALGLIFIINCIGLVPKALLKKEMRFAKVAFSELIGALGFSVVAIFLALGGYGVWSLVGGYLFKTLILTCAIWYFSKWRPNWRFNIKIARQMFHFGKFVFLGSLAFFLRMNLDKIFIGRLLGVAVLGIYALAFNISNILVEYFSNKIDQVIFPAYSKKQNDDNALKRSYLDILKTVSFIALPLTFCVYLLRTELVQTIYGHKWIDVIPVIQILIWSGLFRIFTTSAGALFMAKGKPRYGFWLSSLQVLIFLILIAPFSKLFGIKGVAIVVTLAALIHVFLIMFLLKRLISMRITEMFLRIKVPFLATLMMSFVVLLARFLLANIFLTKGTNTSLLIILLSALASYIFFMVKFDRQFVMKIKTMLIGA